MVEFNQTSGHGARTYLQDDLVGAARWAGIAAALATTGFGAVEPLPVGHVVRELWAAHGGWFIFVAKRTLIVLKSASN
ncbi:hypothetical protein [Cupriavidus sp. CP313]